MTLEQVINGAIRLINRIASEKGIKVVDLGTGHAFDHSFWDFEDKSGIPSVKAKSDDYCIELRPFWSSPEVDVRRKDKDGNEELLIFNYSDYMTNRETDKLEHTGEYKVHEVRVDSHSDYKKCIEEVYAMIDEVEE